MKHPHSKLSALAVAVLLGLSQAVHAVSTGELIITEVMANPAAVGDTVGEWFELYNPTAYSVDLNNLVISDDGADSHTINAPTPLLLGPGSYFVLGNNGDMDTNGGYTPDYVYAGFTLANFNDEIVVSDGATEITRLNYTDGFVVSGRSREVTAYTGAPQSEFDFGLTYDGLTYGLGDTGTPGIAGSYTPPSVPIPPAVWLFGTGLLGLVAVGRRSVAQPVRHRP